MNYYDIYVILLLMVEQLQQVVEATPLRRMTTNEETAAFIKLLASEATSFVTGQTVMFDVGRNMR